MKILVLVSQVVLGVYFLLNAFNHFRNREGLVGYAQSRGAVSPALTVPLTGLLMLVVGISFLFGYRVVLGAWLGVIFLVLAAFLVHHYWTDEGAQKMGEMVNFQKNLALAAALLLTTFLSRDVWVIRLGP